MPTPALNQNKSVRWNNNNKHTSTNKPEKRLDVQRLTHSVDLCRKPVECVAALVVERNVRNFRLTNKNKSKSASTNKQTTLNNLKRPKNEKETNETKWKQNETNKQINKATVSSSNRKVVPEHCRTSALSLACAKSARVLSIRRRWRWRRDNVTRCQSETDNAGGFETAMQRLTIGRRRAHHRRATRAEGERRSAVRRVSNCYIA